MFKSCKANIIINNWVNPNPPKVIIRTEVGREK